MKNRKHSDQSFRVIFAALLILFTFYAAALPADGFASAMNSTISKIDDQDDFDKQFREGRNLIDREEWAQAAEKLRSAIEKYPRGKSADAALYWLAFCHKKQKQFAEAAAALDRLLKDFPASSWVSDARVMKMEIAASFGRGFPAAVGATNSTGGAWNLPAASSVNAVKGIGAAQSPVVFDESLILNGDSTTAARGTPLDREDEIKIAAFQSLLAADPKRGIETMGELLKPDSKASETLKLEILRVVRSPRLSKIEAFSFNAGGSAGVGQELLPLLRETLIKSFQSETNPKIRREIIYAFGNTGDGSADYLKKLYAAAGDDRETKRAIINAFSSPMIGFNAFNAGLVKTRKPESGWLMEIVRTEKDTELRRLALTNLQRFPNWADGEQTIESLARLYDSEPDEAFRISLIRAFSNAAQKQATRKLMDIAKSDKSDKLRLEAIYSLRTSKDPAVLNFLENLIK